MAVLAWIVAAAVVLVVAGNLLEFRVRGQVGNNAVEVGRALGATSSTGARLRPQRKTRTLRGGQLFAALSVLYLLVGAYLVLHRGSIVGDAESRVAQAWYVVASRDPHIAAIGFIWNPLPSIAAIPLVLLHGIWPALTQRAFAGSIVSALCMAGAVVQFRAALREMGAKTSVAIVLTACFALNPMTIYYGANGMSEAMYLLFLVGASRYLLAWTVKGRLKDLVFLGINLAFGYLTRYESLAAAVVAAAVVVVVGTSARDHIQSRRERRSAAIGDVVVATFPVIVAFVGWAITSWVITGQPFEQFTSQYGNSSQVSTAVGLASANGTGWPRIVLSAAQIWSYAPLIPVVAIVVLVVAVKRRDRRFLALGVSAGPLAFSTAAYAGGEIFGWLRFYLPTLPLFLLAAGLLLSPLPGMRPAAPRWLARSSIAAAVAAFVIGVPCVVGSALAMGNTHLGPAEYTGLSWLFRPANSVAEVQNESLLPSAQSIARQVDAMGLRNGSVAVDTVGCGSLVVMNSQNPHQFIITSDRDFQEVVADPAAFNVPYVLVPEDSSQGPSAINVAHPGIFAGGQVGDLSTKVVRQVQTPGCTTFRLIHVLSDDV